MSEPRNGPGSVEEQARIRRDVPRFVIGCEEDEQDMGQMEAGMKNEMFREEDMEDDENESVRKRNNVYFLSFFWRNLFFK